jgi:hypothetical protein
VPHIRNSLHPPLNPSKLLRRKMCLTKPIGAQTDSDSTGKVNGAEATGAAGEPLVARGAITPTPVATTRNLA